MPISKGVIELAFRIFDRLRVFGRLWVAMSRWFDFAVEVMLDRVSSRKAVPQTSCQHAALGQW